MRNTIISGNYIRISIPSKVARYTLRFFTSSSGEQMSDFQAPPKMTPLEGESRSKRVVRCSLPSLIDIVLRLALVLFLRLRYWWVSLWSRASVGTSNLYHTKLKNACQQNEAHANPDVPFPRHELWSL